MSLQKAEVDEAWRQRCIRLAEEGRRAGQAAFRARAQAYNAQRQARLQREAEEARRREAEIERERAAAERRILAEVLLSEWEQRLRTYAVAVRDPERGQAWSEARRDLVAFGTMLQERPEAGEALRQQGRETGWKDQTYLERVVASNEPAHLIDRMLDAVESNGAAHEQAVPVSEHEISAAREPLSFERASSQGIVR